jgi:hypothetical protein
MPASVSWRDIQNAARAIKARTAAEWASLNPVLPAGQLGVESNTGIVRVGDGVTVFQRLSAGVLTAKQTAQVTNSSTAASVDIPGLAIAVQEGHRYLFEAFITVQTALNTSGPVFSTTGPALTNGRWSVEVQQGATGTSQVGWQTNTFGATAGYASGTISAGAGVSFSVRIRGHFQPSADGTVQLRTRPTTDTQLLTVVNEGLMRITDLGYAL